MRIFSTVLLTATFLGSAIVPGWCPQPADLTSPPSQSKGATGAAVFKLEPNWRMRDHFLRKPPGRVYPSSSQTYVRQTKPEERPTKPDVARVNPAINRLSSDGTGGGFVGGGKSGSAGAVPPGRRAPLSNAGSSSGVYTSRPIR